MDKDKLSTDEISDLEQEIKKLTRKINLKKPNQENKFAGDDFTLASDGYVPLSTEDSIEAYSNDEDEIEEENQLETLLPQDFLRNIQQSSLDNGDQKPTPNIEPPTTSFSAIEANFNKVKINASQLKSINHKKEINQNAVVNYCFDELNMQPLTDYHHKIIPSYYQNHGINLSLIGFFVKAVAEALNQHPVVNSQITDKEIIFFNQLDICIAYPYENGISYPVLNNALDMSLIDIEQNIANICKNPEPVTEKPNNQSKGTFTIVNNGSYGAMLASPMLNPPQSAAFGMNKIEKRAIVIEDKIVVRPMMYLSLAYDLKVIDTLVAVQFLKAIKTSLENPSRLKLD